MADTSMTLYAIEDDLAALVETLECVEPAHQNELLQRIGEQMTAAVEKRDRVAQFLRHLEYQEEFAKEEISRLKSRCEELSGARERLQNYVRWVMDQRGVRKLEGRTCTLAIRKNPDAVWIEDVEAIPSEFKTVKTETTLRKNEIKAALKAGREVPGAELRTSERLEVR